MNLKLTAYKDCYCYRIPRKTEPARTSSIIIHLPEFSKRLVLDRVGGGRFNSRGAAVSIPESIIEEIKSRISISEVTSEFVQLKRSGTSLLGLCPFHTEKTPSFHVREEHGSFHCFGCGKHGNAFTLLMELRGLTFPEAVRALARRAGIELPESSRNASTREDDEKARRKRQRARMLTLKVSHWFQERLASSSPAMGYLEERGVQAATRDKFFLGYAPESRQFLSDRLRESQSEFAAAGFEDGEAERLLLEIGLLKSKEGNSEPYDAFRNRIIFPIHKSDGSIIAFGGRLLPANSPHAPDFVSRAPKYLNSSESFLYAKRQTLYGLPQAMAELRKTRHALLVEGYMDVLGVNQIGYQSVLATCGTAVTDQHANTLRRFVERVTILFDGDSAGNKAAAACFEAFLNSGLDSFVVMMPDGEDPDTLAATMSLEDFQAYLETSRRPLFEVYLENLIQEVAGTSELSATASGKVANRFTDLLSRVSNSVEREFFLRRGAERLGVSASSIEKLLQGRAQKTRSFSPLPSRNTAAKDFPRSSQSVPFADGPRVFRGTTNPLTMFELGGPLHEAPQSREQGGAELGLPRKTLSPTQRKAAKFYHQLLIAAVAEPSLSGDLLRLASTQNSEQGFSIPKRLHDFLTELQSGSRAGGAERSPQVETHDASWEQPFETVFEVSEVEVRELLQKHGFSAERVLKEVKVQQGFQERPEGKGMKGGKISLLQMAESVGTRQKLERAIEKLRQRTPTQEENDGGKEEYLLKIAQEKLEKRRTLDRIPKG